MRRGLLRSPLILFVLLLAAAPARADWLQDTLAFQERLGDPLPLHNASWLGTRAGFDVTAQLDAGARALTLTDGLLTPLGPQLTEVGRWLDAHPSAFVLLFVADGADLAPLAGKLYAPAGACGPLPLRTSRRDMRRAGAQALAVRPCAGGVVATGVRGFNAYPECDPDAERGMAFYRGHLVRVTEDAGLLSTARITPEFTRFLVQCGADVLGFEQLGPGDPRLPAAVWTWAPGEPRGAGCAVQRAADARWLVAPCTGKRRFACVTRRGNWTVGGLGRVGRHRLGCAGARFGVPRTGLDAAQLREAMRRARTGRVWLRYRVR